MVKIFSSEKKCPKCKSSDVVRIKRSFAGKFLSMGQDIRKYKCEKCFHTFHFRQPQA